KGMKPARAVTWVFWVQAEGLQMRAREMRRSGQGDAFFFLGPMGFPSPLRNPYPVTGNRTNPPGRPQGGQEGGPSTGYRLRATGYGEFSPVPEVCLGEV